MRVLLVALLLDRNRPVHVDRLAAALWGENAAHGSERALRVQVSRLRSVLNAPGALVTTNAGYTLRVSNDALDAERFETMLAEGRELLGVGRAEEAGEMLRQALRLWRGPALADVDESFAERERARLEEQRLAAIELRVDADLAVGGHMSVVSELQQLAAAHPLRERMHAQLMLALYRAGRQADALDAFRQVRERLADELGLTPGRELRDLERAILNHDPALIHRPSRGPTRLDGDERVVGRDAERAELSRMLQRENAPCLVLIAGEPGVGKSTLARAAARAAQLPVLHGRCDEEPLAPYQPFTEAQVVPETVMPSGDRHVLFETVASAIAVTGDHVLFFIDDLHWADPATLQMLRYALRRVPGLVVLATSRDPGRGGGPIGELAVDLRRDGVFERVLLPGLDVQATGELVAGRADPELVHARTAGNPFFIEQLLRAGADGPVPDSVKALISQRVARLEATEVLQLAAVAGAEFDYGLLVRVLGHEPVLAALDAALNAGLVVDRTADRFAFVHALAREAIYEDLSPLRRAALHLQVAEALEGPASALAHHFVEARRLGTADAAVEWTQRAADEAAGALDWEQEVAQLETALRVLDEFSSQDDATRCRILLRLASCQVPLGQDFRTSCRRAARLARRHGWVNEVASAAVEFARVNEAGVVDAEAVELLELALRELGAADSPWRARVLSRLAETLILDGRQLERCRALSLEGLELARRLNDPISLIAALTGRCTALEGPDAIPERIGLLREALDVADKDDVASSWRYGIVRELGMLHVILGDIREAKTHRQGLEDHLTRMRLDGTYEATEAIRLRAAEAVIEGRLQDAEQGARDFEACASELDDPDVGHLMVAQALPICLEQHREAELLAAVTERADGSPTPALWRAARCLLHARTGRNDEAQSELVDLLADDGAAIPRIDLWLPTVTLLADAAGALSDRTSAAILVRMLRPYPNHIAVFLYGSGPLGPVSERLGNLARLLDDLDGAASAFRRALEISCAMGAPLWSARATEALGRLRDRTGPLAGT